MTAIKAKKSGLEFEVPEGWELSLLDKLTQRGSGHTPDKAFESYYNGGIKWISLADSSRLDNGLIFETESEISELGIKKSSAVVHPAGTVLMSRDAGVGKSAVMGLDMAVSQHFIVWRCKKNVLDNWFLYYWLQFRKGYFERQAVGSTIKTIGLPLFKKLKIPHPQFTEQRAIAKVLGTIDQTIQRTEALIAQKELRKKWLMQNLLTGKKRLKGFEGEWREIKFGSFLKESRIRGNTGLEAKKITVKLYGKGVYSKDEKILGSANTQYYIRKSGQFIYSKLDFLNGAFGVVPKELNYFESTLDLPCFDVFEDRVNKVFLLYFVSREGFYKRYDDGAIGGRKAKRIQVNEFLNIKPKLPSIKEQTSIAQVLQTADQEIKLLKTKAEKLREQKKGIMQVLLTGKVRVENLKLNNL